MYNIQIVRQICAYKLKNRPKPNILNYNIVTETSTRGCLEKNTYLYLGSVEGIS